MIIKNPGANGAPTRQAKEEMREEAVRQNTDRDDVNIRSIFSSNIGAYRSQVSHASFLWTVCLVLTMSLPLPVYSYSWNARLHQWSIPKQRMVFINQPRTTSPFPQTMTRLQSLVDENNSDTRSSSIKKVITTKKGKEATVQYKDFWGSSISSTESEERPPYVPTLDPFWGSLPKAAYQYETDEIYDPKPTCLIAMDLTPRVKEDNLVEMVQKYLESGFSTFHGATPGIIQQFYRQTPAKLIGRDSIHWVLKYRVPTRITSLQGVRQDILDHILDPMSSSCTDAIDTLVVQYNPKSPYHMDTLYVLNELQEEGFIRSIGLEDFPQNMVAKAVVECGFYVSLVQQPGSLLIPPDSEKLISPIEYQWITNPLLDDLLLHGQSDDEEMDARKKKRKRTSNPNERVKASSKKQQKQWDATLEKWAKLQRMVTKDEAGKEVVDSAKVEEAFETKVMNVLQEMAWRYGVPLKSLILRWTMELKATSSVSLPIPKGDYWNDMDFAESASNSRWKVHIQEMRKAFTFRLEEEDKAVLKEISKRPETEQDLGMMMDLLELEEFLVQQGLPAREIEALLMQEEKRQTASSRTVTDYPKIDFANPKLWL